MADQFDRAQELDAVFREQALAIHKRAASQGTGTARTICVDCDEKIPQARRIAVPGCLRCVECATLYERLKGGL
ncbi:TraR/DksA family transcriptional regulator [Desulfopila inferna]|uniref:TraR/DksA family transcriptional regulator n=1 Tax=Desulfopila inferna TaxID=468528 RepID=UPI00196672A6|nr:TraR/DksA family transcriptional regulator [Desulfopila inferna]